MQIRRRSYRRIFVIFLATLFSFAALSTMAAISTNKLRDTAVKNKTEADGSADEYQDVRYTMVGGKIVREFLSEEEVAKENETIRRIKEEEEARRKAAEERKDEPSNSQIAEYVPPAGTKIVYLTFDDGPGPDTERLLDVLKKYNVKATFFVTCNRANYRNAIKRAASEGHTIGLHTCSHDYARVYASDDAYFADLNEVSNMVKELTGKETRLIRFPGGSSNTVSKTYSEGIMSRLVNEITARGYTYFDWNVSSGDAGNIFDAGTVYNNITRNLRGDYSVVLQHDIKGFSVDAVEAVIQFGQKYGFTFKALDASSPTAHHRINN
jgi:peptidoglycan/xylan/chitin deacetylase (PgdA/CDA1 family)